MSVILLDNKELTAPDRDDPSPNLYYPRLQINKRRGWIILAISRDETLTKGILVAKTEPEGRIQPAVVPGNRDLNIGTELTDWEVCGPLEDYNGDVTVTFKNIHEVYP